MNELQIGWASRDISTDKPINIPGQFHMRISQGIMDPLMVSALVIDNGADLVVFVAADLVVVRSGLLDELRAKVAERNPQIPVEKILLNATHTHTGASHYADGGRSLSNNTSTALPGEVPGGPLGRRSLGMGRAIVRHDRMVDQSQPVPDGLGVVAVRHGTGVIE